MYKSLSKKCTSTRLDHAGGVGTLDAYASRNTLGGQNSSNLYYLQLAVILTTPAAFQLEKSVGVFTAVYVLSSDVSPVHHKA